MKLLLTISIIFLSLLGFGQGVNEPVLVGSSLTVNMVIAKAGYDNAPTVIFFPGNGEVGTDTTGLLLYGPLWAMKNGWKGYVRGVKWNIVAVQPATSSFSVVNLNRLVDTLKARYNIDTCRTYFTGLSLGGAIVMTRAMTIQNNARPWFAPAVVAMSAHTTPNPDSIQQLKFPLYGGNYFGLIGNSDSAGRPLTMNAYRYMNNIVPGSAKVYIYSGGHSGWNTFYDTTYRSFGDGQNIYEWLDMFSKRPYASASESSITTSSSTVTLNGIAKRFVDGRDGTNNTLAWTKISGTGGTITSPGNASTTVTGLNAAGSPYTFRLTSANPSGGLSSTYDVTVNITEDVPPPVANAGSDQNTTNTSVTLSGSGTAGSGATITGYAWVKLTGTGGTITSPGSATTTVTGLPVGTHIYRLTVTQSDAQTDTDDVMITIEANSGPPQSATHTKKHGRKTVIKSD